MASAETSPVTLGVWTDHSRIGALAKTVTVTDKDAVVLVAFLAALIGFVGIRSWRITRFISFMVFTHKSDVPVETGNQGSTKVLPQQAILRNAETATGAAFGLLSSYVFPKDKLTAPKSRQPLKDLSVIAAALAHGLLFMALSILTSRIVLGKTVVSKPTSSCGQWVGKGDDHASFVVTNELTLNATLDADNYVQNCYFGATKSGIFDCQRLASQSIPFSVSHNASCPFSKEVCRTNSSFAVDTGNVSLAQLGINTKLADQLYFRRRSVCAPIREDLFYVAKYTSENMTWLSDQDVIRVYRFDPGSGSESFLHLVNNDIRSLAYELNAYHIPLNYSSETGAQTTPLQLSDQLPEGYHGPSIVLLSGRGVTFDKEYDDPLWSVHTEVEYANGTYNGINLDELPTTYRMDRALNIIGCDERFQICAKSTGRCAPWSGLLSVVNETVLDESATDDAEKLSELIIPLALLSSIIPGTSIPNSIAGRDASPALRASRYMRLGKHFYLEPEQWKTEVTYWFAIALARLQLDMFKTIERPAGVDASRTRNQWADSPLMILCGRVKYRSANHTSLSFVGIIVVVVLSAALVILSFFESLIDLLPSKWRGDRLLQWRLSENLALLEGKERLENESAGESEEQMEETEQT